MSGLPRVIPSAPERGDIERFLGVREIREMFSVSDRHIRRWVSCGKFPKPYLKIGRMLRWRVEDVQRFIEEHRLK